jgi:O-antigen ligase/Flp pilus assembly protein TadD
MIKNKGYFYFMENGILNCRFYKKSLLTNLKIFVLSISLLIYKNIYEFRINQEMILKLFVIIAIILWIIKLLSVEGITWNKNKLNLPVYFFIIILSFSLMISNAKRVSFGDYIIFISYIILYFTIINVINQKKEFNSFIKIFSITSFLVSIYALIHYYGLDPYFSEINQITSTIGQKNWISNYLAMIFPIIFSYYLLEKIRKNKVIYYLLLSILYATLMICQSRGIWISISLTLIFAIYIIIKFNLLKIFQENKKWLVLLLVTFLIITIIYSTDNPLEKSEITVTERAISTFDEQDPSLNMHLLTWNATINMIKEKPLFGSGIGTFKMNYLDYQAEFLKNNPNYIEYSGKAREAHNEYLQIWAELGIIGLGIFIGIILTFFNLIKNYLKKIDDNKDKMIVFGLVLGITCFLIHCLFTFPFHVPVLGSTFFILLGLTVVYINGFGFNEVDKNNIKRIKINTNNSIKKIIIVLMFILAFLLIYTLVFKPYSAEIHYFKGIKNYENKNYNNALKDFKYAAHLDSGNGRILHALGTTYYHLDIQDEAQKTLQRTKYYFNDRNIYRNLGLSYMQSGNYEEAEKEFQHAIYLDPKFTKAYIDLAYLHAIQKDYDKAIIEWNKILEIEPNFSEKYNILYYLGLTYGKKEMPDKAFGYFVQALELAPEGSIIIEEIEEEIYNIYKSKLDD